MAIQTINPTTGQAIKAYQSMAEAEFKQIIDQSHAAFLTWRHTSFKQRSSMMQRLAEILHNNATTYANLITQEMGKPITQAKGEIEMCAWLCQHIAEHAEQYLTTRHITTEMSKSYVTYKPLGIVFAIMPWNFPFWQVVRFAVPAIMAGNAAMLKHAPIVTGVALAIESAFREAGFPLHLFRTVIVDNDAAAKIIQHPHISAVTLTGSDVAGRIVASEAAQSLKKVVLELGGSDPFVVLADADLDAAAQAAVASRLNNTGQVCIAAKRIITVPAIRDELTQKMLSLIATYKMGDPMDEDVSLGPLAREDLRDHLHEQVQSSIAQGASLLLGGDIPKESGFFYPATVLAEVKPGITAYEQELFGPVVTFIDAQDETDAIRIANDTPYGLSAVIFTQDLAKGEQMANEIEAGTCVVNDFVRSDPRLPFGGIKQSGFGRELSQEGIREFVNVKTVVVK